MAGTKKCAQIRVILCDLVSSRAISLSLSLSLSRFKKALPNSAYRPDKVAAQDDEADEVLEPREPATHDEVNEIAMQLKKISVVVGNWGEAYENAAVMVNDACDIIRSVERRMHSKAQKEKQTTSRQPRMFGF